MPRVTSLAALALFALACSEPTTPTRPLVTGAISLAVTQDLHPWPAGIADGEVRLCKTANAAGTFTFNVDLPGGGAVDATPSITIVTPGSTVCLANVLYTSTVNNTTFETVVITEQAPPANWALTAINTVQYIHPITYVAGSLNDLENVGARSATVRINNDMAKTVTFTNTFTAPPTTGCTYTKGWYRNKGSGTITLTLDGRTVAQQQAIFDATPGKPGGVTFGGNNSLLNLYQQLLAALNNLDGDATGGPASVDAAISAALAGTGGTGLNITTTLTNTQISDLINALSAFNEGTLAGWPHCDDN